MTSNELPFSVYDCFTEKRFGGNVGVIVWNSATLKKNQMLKLAREFNAPVTGYIISQKKNKILARFFMPNSEIAMCGHVTIGIFTHLFKNSNKQSENYTLEVPAGNVHVNVKKNNKNIPEVMFSLDIPKPIKANVNVSELSKALNIKLNDISLSSPLGILDAGLKHLFVHVKNKKKIFSISPNFENLKKISKKIGVQTIACFSFRNFNSSKTIILRDFCPVLGVNEAPASGTTNGALSGYLLANNLIKPQSQEIITEQGDVIGRPSKIKSKIEIKKGIITNLKIGGCAIESFSGNIKPFISK